VASSPVAFSPAPAALSKGEATAARILEVALDQFSRLGFERVTMGGIADAAKVSQAALHYHFQDKVQLWRSAMLALGAVIAEEARLLDVAQDAPAVAQLRMAMRLFLEVSRKHPALARIVTLEGMVGGERLAWLDKRLFGNRNRRLAELVRRAIADGDVKPYPPEQIVITLQTGAVGALNLAPMIRETFGTEIDTEAAWAGHEDMVMDALFGGFLTDQARPTRLTASKDTTPA
jgi:TetR/AcrR family transcriptional regulator